MKRSTKRIYGLIEGLNAGYFNNKRHWASIQNGRAAFINRASQYFDAAAGLYEQAETRAARERIGRFMDAITNDTHKIIAEYFASDTGVDLTKLTIIDSYIANDGSAADGLGFTPGPEDRTVEDLYKRCEKEAADTEHVVLYADIDGALREIMRTKDPVTNARVSM